MGLWGGPSSTSVNPTQLHKLQSEVYGPSHRLSLVLGPAGAWLLHTATGPCTRAPTTGLGKGLGLGRSCKRAGNGTKRGARADLAAEEKKEPAKKDGKHEQKNEWWEEDWKKGVKKWDDWWEEKEEQWQAWSKNQRWEPDGEDTEEEEVPSSSTQKENKCGSQKERAKSRWLMKTCKNESQEEKEKLKLGALGACRLKRLLDRQEDRKNKLEAAQLAQAAAANAAAAAQAAQAAAASAQWQQWQMQQAQLVEAQAMWHHHAYYQGQGGQPHQWGWHHQTMEQPVEQPKQPKPHRHQPGLVCTHS